VKKRSGIILDFVDNQYLANNGMKVDGLLLCACAK